MTTAIARRMAHSSIFIAIVIGTALLSAGCRGPHPYSSETAQSLEHRVLAISLTAKSHNYASALQQLGDLQAADDQALTDGDIDQARHDAIAVSIRAINDDLAALQAKASTAAQAKVAQRANAARQAQQPRQPAPPDHHGHGHDGHGQGGGDGGGD